MAAQSHADDERDSCDWRENEPYDERPGDRDGDQDWRNEFDCFDEDEDDEES